MLKIERLRSYFWSVSLRSKLVIVITLPMMSLVTIVLAVAARIEIRQTKQAMVLSTQSTIGAMSQDFERIELLADQQVAADIADRLRSFESIELVYVYDPGGDVLFSYRRPDIAATDPPEFQDEGSSFSEDCLKMFVPLQSPAHRFGVAFVQVSTAGLNRDVRRSVFATLIAGVATVLIGICLAAILQRFISRPVVELRRTAQRVTKKMDYSVRAQKFSDDELGAVVDAFNVMLQEIQQRNTELQLAHDGQFRTADRRIRMRPINICLSATSRHKGTRENHDERRPN